MNYNEKRRSLRFPVQLPIDFGRSDFYMSSLCSNISRSGMYMETSAPVDVGNQVTLFITFPHRGEPLKVAGKVVWKRLVEGEDLQHNNLAGLGVQFIGDLPDEMRLPEGFEGEEREFDPTQGDASRRIPRIYVN